MSDFKSAERQLIKSPGFTAVAVLTLALGAWIPARRAARVDPMVALRME